ncbi:hypothetical protein [Methylocucumis oryzae]|uniref:Uncharacterized protein n=1 Tax=Methylocucumis oryzae TaxID=1632867 RepID=A0A0F3IJY4_9GAMM|nr:hypothetical protein [Methylocucumis oryzae]KJV06838.1 hypothetical protein VZ94_08640 [Methylocucumis oryzae]
MTEEIELKLLSEIEALKQEIQQIKNESFDKKPIFQYSKIRDSDLESVLDIDRSLDKSAFKQWFAYTTPIDETTQAFFNNLIEENEPLIDSYSEEDLKVNFLVPILNKVHFKSFENNIRDFYELPLRYETARFIFTGTTDFVVASGLIKSKTPYFFIQEFKRQEEFGNPRPQLVAELISAVELNQWRHIKGAYIIGAMWHFVILEKLAEDKYRYFVSQHFDSMRLDDLIAIYQRLLFIKQEIIALQKQVADL